MRLSEKTLELNFCSQFAAASGRAILWYGLTQLEEAKLGFDVATRVGGRSLLFQVKASSHTLVRSGRRRFRLPHDQLVELRKLVRPGRPRRVFYALPLVGTSGELAAKGGHVFANSWFLDVSTLASTPPPTTRSGSPRRNKVHYADVAPHSVVVHSEPVEYRLLSSQELVAAVEQPRGALTDASEGNLELASVTRYLAETRRARWGRLVVAVLLGNDRP